MISKQHSTLKTSVITFLMSMTLNIVPVFGQSVAPNIQNINASTYEGKALILVGELVTNCVLATPISYLIVDDNGHIVDEAANIDCLHEIELTITDVDVTYSTFFYSDAGRCFGSLSFSEGRSATPDLGTKGPNCTDLGASLNVDGEIRMMLSEMITNCSDAAPVELLLLDMPYSMPQWSCLDVIKMPAQSGESFEFSIQNHLGRCISTIFVEPEIQGIICTSYNYLQTLIEALSGSKDEAFIAKINAAASACTRGQADVAINSLNALIHVLEAQRDKKLSSSEVDLLIDLTNTLIQSIISSEFNCGEAALDQISPDPIATRSEVIKIYPNPTSGQIHLTQPSQELSVYDAIGQRIQMLKNVTDIDLTNEGNGFYFIKIDDEVHRIVKY